MPCQRWLWLSWRHGPGWELGLGKLQTGEAELLGLGMAAGWRWTRMHAMCLDCQHGGGTVTGSCHAGDPLQPSPRLLPFSMALLLCQSCSCPCRGWG